MATTPAYAPRGVYELGERAVGVVQKHISVSVYRLGFGFWVWGFEFWVWGSGDGFGFVAHV